ncbi:MAG: hypothetical protein ACJA1C_001175 [Crocinitomicaceae bacterium]|jgi:hypothetical protein
MKKLVLLLIASLFSALTFGQINKTLGTFYYEGDKSIYVFYATSDGSLVGSKEIEYREL